MDWLEGDHIDYHIPRDHPIWNFVAPPLRNERCVLRRNMIADDAGELLQRLGITVREGDPR